MSGSKVKVKGVKGGGGAGGVFSTVGREISGDTRAIMFDGMAKGKSKLLSLDEESGVDGVSYVKDVLLKCVGCEGTFSHRARLPDIAYQIACPHCAREHVLVFTPASRYFTLSSGTVEVSD